MKATGLIALALLLCGTSKTQTLEEMKQELNQMKQDDAVIETAYQNYNQQLLPKLQGLSGSLGTFSSYDVAYQQLAEYQRILEGLRSNDLPEIRKIVTAFEAKYGNSTAFDEKINLLIEQIGIAEAAQIKDNEERRAFESQYRNQHMGRYYTNAGSLKRAVDDFDAEMPTRASSVANTAYPQLAILEYQSDPATIYAIAQFVETYCRAALTIDPQCVEAKNYLTELERVKTKKINAIETARQNARFPNQHSGFSGPGSADELAATALNYISDNDSFKHKYLKAFLTGEWDEYKSVFGVTLYYRLPVIVAYENKENPELVHVIYCEFQTSSNKKEAPFNAYYIRTGYDMYKKNLNE